MTDRPLAAVDLDQLRVVMGKRVRAARRALDVSQARLGEMYAKTDGWIGSIEAGKAFPPPYLVATLQAATGWPHSWFFGEGDELRPPTR